MRWAALLTTTVLGVGTGAALPLPAADAAAGRCADVGVTVVVDFGPLGGTGIGCDPAGGGQPGVQVVGRAGFSLSYVSTQPGFVCRVDGTPGPETCARTPPQNAYWALFWSDGSSGRWTYSNAGIGSLEVPDGGSIGWRFQDGGARDLPSAAPTVAGRTSGPTPTPEPQPEPKPEEPTPEPRPQPTQPTQPPAGSAGGRSGAASTPSATPEDRSGRAGDGGDNTAPADGKGHGTGAGRAGGGTQGDEGDGNRGDDGRSGVGDRRPAKAGGPEAARSRTASGDTVTESTEALSPASRQGSSGSGDPALVLLAGGAMAAMAGAAGIIAWRRRG